MRAVFAAAALVLLVAASVTAATAPAADQSLLALFKTPNTDFPTTAMIVGGQRVSGQYLAYAVRQFQANSAAHGGPATRADAVGAVIDRLATAAAISAEANKRGYAATDQEITTYLTSQTEGALAIDPSKVAAVWSANGDKDAAAYLADPAVRAIAGRMIAGGKLLAAMQAADPSFDPHAWAEQLKSSVTVQLFFTP